jgi:hypothetical protein
LSVMINFKAVNSGVLELHRIETTNHG